MALVKNKMTLPGGDPVQTRVSVDVELHQGGWHGDPSETEIIGVKRAQPDESGTWQLNLTPNADILPSPSFYRAVEKVGAARKIHDFLVPGPVAFTAGSRTSNVVTLTGLPVDHGIEVADSVTVAATDTGYNGTFTVTVAGSTSISYAQTAADDAASGAGTVTKAVWDLADIVVPGLAVDPAFGSEALVTHGELMDILARGSAGFIRSMNPPNPLNPVVGPSSTAEESMLTAAFSMARLPHEGVFRLVAGGFFRNISGGNIDYTFRVRNLTDGLVIASAVLTIPSDASGARAWRFCVEGEGQVVLADSVVSAGQLAIGPGSTDTAKQTVGQNAVAVGSDPQNWDVTGQMSVSNAQASISCYTVQVQWALAGE